MARKVKTPASASPPPSAKRFRVAFSFAGEKRGFVEQVAAILAERFGEARVLYDRYHRPEFSRSDLAFYLPDLYHDQAELIVAVFCPDYEKKEWPGLEWRAIFDLLKKRRVEEVMLTRFGRVEVPGLYSLAGYADLDHETPSSAATLILERLALNERRPRDYYTKSAPTQPPALRTPTPNNLPRLQPFFGRETELAAIREALDPESRTWGVLIDGPGGMGKTSLAVRAAYDCPPDLFDRIVFLSAKDRELDDDGVRPLGPFMVPGLLAMLNEIARELARPAIAKAPEGERFRLLLDALRGERVLLILDNLESLLKAERDLLLTFVSRLPLGSKAILTSRRPIGSASERRSLEKLGQAAALDTLGELARHHPLLARTSEAERIRLYERTGGNPLLLVWTAGQLGRGRCRNLEEALAFLRSCPADNDPLEFVFGDLAQEFTAEETRVLVALTYFTLPAKVEYVAELADLDSAPVETALGTLVNRALVVPDQDERAFALVPMVADFLRVSRPEVVAKTARRLEARAYTLVVENGYEKHDRFSVLSSAWPIVAPALPLLLTWPNDQIQVVCRALERFLDFTGRWDEWLSLSQAAEARAVAAGDFFNAGWRAYQAGWVHCLREQAEAVLACADRAAAHWQRANAGTRERATAIRLRGLGHKLRREHSAALGAYREALGLFRTLPTQTADVAATLNSLASVEHLSGDFASAERDFREGWQAVGGLGHVEGVATLTGNLAEVALNQKDWPAAEVLARNALALAEKLGRQELIAEDYRLLAQALADQGKAAEGLPHAQRALEIYTQLGTSEIEGARATLAECERGT